MEWMEILKLKEILDYDPETGVFTRKKNVAPNARLGMRAGTRNGGYLRFRVNKKKYYAHRIAWLYMTGVFPAQEIDHINGDKSDNRWNNLREASRSINMQNQRRAQSDNKSTGVLGVYPSGGKFMAIIHVNSKAKYLGTHKTIEDASAAYLSAKRQLHAGCMV